ncbi:nuclear transport factor 2 family protein [Maribellus sediminis]|uniref:nuclear transport factor 2 family protein n=1 Tax=Maribellus sediminis TaxID=2696285 RepID=UPI0014307372|nr:nuclear transport factor 2 family protein [Maribellus sediminis]
MKLQLPFTFLTGLVFLISSCVQLTNSKETDTAVVIDQVKSRVYDFHAADTAMNAQAIIDLLWPEFTMLADRNYTNYEQVKAGSFAFMESLAAFHSDWTDLKIIPLGDQYAVSSFIFTDSIVAKDGTITRATGPNTFVWEKREGEWKLIYADADHYPVKE